MIKKEIYPKTKRLGLDGKITVTEKIDGSNLCIFKKDGKLFIAQRSTIYEFGEVEAGVMYKGLHGWLTEHAEELKESLNETSALCGEWIGMGKLKYPFELKFMMFAKANVTDEILLKNISYNHDYFIYPFVNKEIPEFIGVVPTVYQGNDMSHLFKDKLDEVYKEYTDAVGRDVEGFVIEYDGGISKYVRMKNGKIEEHFANGEGKWIKLKAESLS